MNLKNFCKSISFVRYCTSVSTPNFKTSSFKFYLKVYSEVSFRQIELFEFKQLSVEVELKLK